MGTGLAYWMSRKKVPVTKLRERHAEKGAGPRSQATVCVVRESGEGI